MESSYFPGGGSGFSHPGHTQPGDSVPARRSNGLADESNQRMSSGKLHLQGAIPSPQGPGSNLLSPAGSTAPHHGFPRWVHRVFLVVEVMIWIELGMILMVVPWTRAWTDNGLILAYPHLREMLGTNFVRGAVTGVGLLDLWTGLWKAVHFGGPSERS